MNEYKGISGTGKVIVDGNNVQIKQMLSKDKCTNNDIISFSIEQTPNNSFIVSILTKKCVESAKLLKQTVSSHKIAFKDTDADIANALFEDLSKIAPNAVNYNWQNDENIIAVNEALLSPEEININKQLEKLNAGELTSIPLNNIVLSENEIGYFIMIAQLVEVTNRYVGSTGSGAGISFRVAKGIRVGTGGGRSNAIYKDIESRYTGTINLTNNRFIFLNQKKTVEFELKKVTAVSEESGGVYIHLKGRDKPHVFTLPGNGNELLVKAMNVLVKNK